jgi:hypothetical protein
MQKLDRLTQDEARVTTAQTLEVVHKLVDYIEVAIHGARMYSASSF